MNKKPAFSVAFVVYEDGTYKDQIILESNGNQVAANVIFNMMTGQVSQGILDYIQKKYPKQFVEINTMVDNLNEELMMQATGIMEDMKHAPVVRATEVFGGKSG